MGVITAVGREKDCDTAQPQTLIDARGTCVAPGLIDSHVHPVFGDWTPRQSQLGWIDSTMNGGVTTMISAGGSDGSDWPPDVSTRPSCGPRTVSTRAWQSRRWTRPLRCWERWHRSSSAWCWPATTTR